MVLDLSHNYLGKHAFVGAEFHLVVRTSTLSELKGEPSWAYEIGKRSLLLLEAEIHSDAGYLSACCSECATHRPEAVELHALHQALLWVEEHHPERFVYVVGNSDVVVNLAELNFEILEDLHPNCPTLRWVISDLCRLHYRLNLYVFPADVWEDEWN